MALGGTALSVVPHSGKAGAVTVSLARSWGGEQPSSRVAACGGPAAPCSAPGWLPPQCSLLHPLATLLWVPWRDKDLPMGAAFEATPADKITQRYKSS